MRVTVADFPPGMTTLSPACADGPTQPLPKLPVIPSDAASIKLPGTKKKKHACNGKTRTNTNTFFTIIPSPFFTLPQVRSPGEPSFCSPRLRTVQAYAVQWLSANIGFIELVPG